MENNTYYILITSIDEYTEKLHDMLKVLSYQIENYSTPHIESKNIRILVCNDYTKKHIKKELLLNETNYSQNHVFLDVLDDVNSTYVIDFVDNCVSTQERVTKKNATVMAYNSKYFKS